MGILGIQMCAASRELAACRVSLIRQWSQIVFLEILEQCKPPTLCSPHPQNANRSPMGLIHSFESCTRPKSGRMPWPGKREAPVHGPQTLSRQSRMSRGQNSSSGGISLGLEIAQSRSLFKYSGPQSRWFFTYLEPQGIEVTGNGWKPSREHV